MLLKKKKKVSCNGSLVYSAAAIYIKKIIESRNENER